jgi:hypothetical protein
MLYALGLADGRAGQSRAFELFSILTTGVIITVAVEESFRIGWCDDPPIGLYFLAAVYASRTRGLHSGLLTAILGSFCFNFFLSQKPHIGFQMPVAREASAHILMLVSVFVVRRNLRPKCVEEPNTGEGYVLPFTSSSAEPSGLHGTGHRYWDVVPSGDWCADLEVGEEYARMWLHLVRTQRPRPVISWILGDMIAAGKFTGVEAGFVLRIAEAANYWRPRKK